MLKFCRKAVYDVFKNVLLSVASLFEGQLSGIGKFLMVFAKMCFERDPRFQDWRKAIPGPDRLSEFPVLLVMLEALDIACGCE